MSTLSSLTARRVVRSLSHRSTPSIDWHGYVFKNGSAELKAAATSFQSWFASAENMAETYKAPPSPIDFESTKSAVKDKELVNALEQLYKTAKPPAITHAWEASDKAAKEQLIEDARSRVALMKEMVDDTQKEIEYQKANRTTRTTTVTQLYEMYPELEEEVQTELENREWFKDTIAPSTK